MTTSATTGWDGIASVSARLPDRDALGELADRLAREFDAPVGLLDPTERIWRVRVGAQHEDFPDPEACVCTMLGLGGTGRVFLWRPMLGPVWWLGLPVATSPASGLVALIGFASGPEMNRIEPLGATLPGTGPARLGRSGAGTIAHGGGIEPDGRPSPGGLRPH